MAIPAYEGKKDYLFVSYAHKNSERVLPLIETLFREKYRVWYDEGIAPGSEWPHNIETHLKMADTVLVVLSKESLASLNCENEVVNAIHEKKKILVYHLDESSHPLLEDYPSFKDETSFVSSLNSNLLGDGSGYDVSLNNRRRFSIWNFLLGLAVVLVIGLIAGVVALNEGYFDAYLPGRNEVDTTEYETEETVKVEINDESLERAIKEATGNTDEYEAIDFKTEENKDAMWKAVGYENWSDHSEEMTYHDLKNCEINTIYVNGGDDTILELMVWLPNLEYIVLDSPEIHDFTSLVSCKNLKAVYVRKGNFPLVIPEERSFEIIYGQKYD